MDKKESEPCFASFCFHMSSSIANTHVKEEKYIISEIFSPSPNDLFNRNSLFSHLWKASKH